MLWKFSVFKGLGFSGVLFCYVEVIAMFRIKNSVMNIFRYRSKYVSYGILYLLLLSIASVCVGIYMQMSVATKTIAREYASVSVLREYIIDIGNLPDRMSEADYDALKEIEHVDDIKMLEYHFHTDFLKQDAAPLKVSINSSDDIDAPVFILGYNISLMHLVSEEFLLESGRLFENENECVISKNPSADDEASQKWNSLSLGDRISVHNDDGMNKEYTITGILESNDDDHADINRRFIYTSLEGASCFDVIAPTEDAGMLTYSLREISIEDLTSNNIDINSDYQIMMGYEVLVYLDDPENFLDVQDDFYRNEYKGHWFTLEPMFPDFKSLLNMTRVMATNASGFMVVIAVLLIFVTVITTVMLLGTRKYEIAVLRSMGMKKSELIISYLIENLVFIWGITIVSFIMARFITPFFTVSIFKGMQTMVSPDVYERITGSFGWGDYIKNFMIVFGGSTAIVLISSIMSCINILRFEPLKIFNKRF